MSALSLPILDSYNFSTTLCKKRGAEYGPLVGNWNGSRCYTSDSRSRRFLVNGSARKGDVGRPKERNHVSERHSDMNRQYKLYAIGGSP
jgi:hypothetical protein